MTKDDERRFEALGYRLQLAEEDGVWVATARRLDTGEAFGPPVPGDAADEAAGQLAGWLEWQHRHAAALAALQAAEAAYHRVAAQAGLGGADSALREQVTTALEALDDRRRELDTVRGQRPWPH
ncbi:MAG: hypothetical protein AB1635_16260 [Acidobacteriota bacterium]